MELIGYDKSRSCFFRFNEVGAIVPHKAVIFDSISTISNGRFFMGDLVLY